MKKDRTGRVWPPSPAGNICQVDAVRALTIPSGGFLRRNSSPHLHLIHLKPETPTGASATNASPAMTSGVAVGKSSSRISTWVHSSGAMNVTVGGGPAGSALLISIAEYCRPSPPRPEADPPLGRRSPRAAWAARRASRSHLPMGRQVPKAISPVTTSAPSRHGHAGAGGTACHLVGRHVPDAACRPEPVLEVHDHPSPQERGQPRFEARPPQTPTPTPGPPGSHPSRSRRCRDSATRPPPGRHAPAPGRQDGLRRSALGPLLRTHPPPPKSPPPAPPRSLGRRATSNRSSACMEIPAPVPGFGASVRATSGTPAARSRRTFSSATSHALREATRKSDRRASGAASVRAAFRPSACTSSATAESSAETMTESGRHHEDVRLRKAPGVPPRRRPRRATRAPGRRRPKAIASRGRLESAHVHYGGEPLGGRGLDDRGDGLSVERGDLVTPKRSASLSDDPTLLAATPVPDSSCSMPASPRFSSTSCRAGVRLPTCRGTAVSPAPLR